MFMKRLLLSLSIIFCSLSYAQEPQSPSEFLGYPLGSQFTRHHEVVDYFNHLAATASSKVVIEKYGQTNERRPLFITYISSSKNIEQLENIRKEHIATTKGEGAPNTAIVWLSYNVHGNESVSTEAAMQTAYDLLTKKAAYLENTVVIIDPCVNPDGRDRYVNWYYQYKNSPNNVNADSKEHHEGWLNGRSNHYMFDLNRDWAWLTQKESQQRIKVFNKWLPHVHVDFHEQGINNPYYFAPAAEPFHEVITPFQRDFQVTIGKNHAKYFDENGWFYFTKEIFDLFYPSYGDTFPIYNGAIGMTYEQGGSGRAGLGVITNTRDTLTLKDRIDHHYTTGISTVEIATKNAERLNTEFKKFYTNKKFKYNSYVLSGNEDNITSLTKLLQQHEITYGYANQENIKGYDYASGKNKTIKSTNKHLVVSTQQPKGTLVKVLFEPNAKLTDSLTYDITAWSLPYAYGLETLATEQAVPFTEKTEVENQPAVTVNKDTYAYLTDWNSIEDARFLADLLEQKVRVRSSEKAFTSEGHRFERGSLIITQADNKHLDDFTNILAKAAATHKKNLIPTSTGFVEKGKDFGSDYIHMIQPPKIAILSGSPSSTLRFGEIWYFFEQQLQYPVTVLDTEYASDLDVSDYDILILPDGRYSRFFNQNKLERLADWVKNGGKLIAMGGAISGISGDEFSIKEKKEEKEEDKNQLQPYEDIQRERMKDAITGAIFKTELDVTNPLAFGYTSPYYSLKLGTAAYEYLNNGTVGYITDKSTPLSGFAGSKAQEKIKNTMIFGVENHGRGNVIYMVDNPLFRGFWKNGQLLMANAIFMVH